MGTPMSGTDIDPNAAQISYWNSEAGPRWVAMQESMNAMLAHLMNVALDRAHPAVGETILDIGCGCLGNCLKAEGRADPLARRLFCDWRNS